MSPRSCRGAGHPAAALSWPKTAQTLAVQALPAIKKISIHLCLLALPGLAWAAAGSAPPDPPPQPGAAAGGAAPQAAPPAAPSPLDMALLAGTCFACHGAQGVAPPAAAQAMPRLQGRPAAELLQRMQALRRGQVAQASVMPLLLQGYDEAQLQALAQWFAQSPPTQECGTSEPQPRPAMPPQAP